MQVLGTVEAYFCRRYTREIPTVDITAHKLKVELLRWDPNSDTFQSEKDDGLMGAAGEESLNASNQLCARAKF